MKYESCTLKTTQVIMSEPKCWESSVDVTLTFDLLTPKCNSIFLSPFCICEWNMKAVPWKLLKLPCQNHSVDKVQLWPWPLTFWPKNVLVSSSHHPTSMYEIWKLYFENYSSYRVRSKVLTKLRCDFDFLTPKMYRYLPLTILHLCMKYESCTLKTTCTQVIVSEPKCWRTDRQIWFL